MARGHVPAEPKVDELMKAAKQLSATELRQFSARLASWQKRNGQRAEEEVALLGRIAENSRLPSTEQRRFNRLRRRHQCERLTKAEETDLQALWRRVEQMNAERLDALAKLALRRGISVGTLMRELALPENRDVF